MPGTIPTYPAGMFYECAFNAAPTQATVPPYWTDISARAKFPWSTTRGRQYELDTVPAGEWRVPLENKDGALDPSNTASAFYPNVIPYRQCRIRSLLGVNQLTVDQATAGEGSGYLGAIPVQMNVSNDFGYPVTIVSSASAFQGSQVYQAVLPATAGAFSTVALVTQVPVTPGTSYTFQAQAQVTAGNTVPVQAVVTWYGQGGTPLPGAGGNAQTLTSGAGSWTQISVSGQAPTTAYAASLKLQITSGLSAATTFQVDGLQFEISATATPFQVPQSLSVNLFPRAIATGTASMAATDTVGNYFTLAGAANNTLAQGQYLTAAPSGQSTALAWTSPVGTTSSSAVLYAGNWLGQNSNLAQPDNVQVSAGTTYTASVYLSRLSSADATVQVQVSIAWFTSAGGAAILTSHGSSVTVPVGSWARATCTAAAPAGAVWGRVHLQITSPGSTTAQNTIYATGWQFEAAASASTWMDPGHTRYIYTGLVERWPQTWLMNGTYGQVGAIGVDAEALIAQDTLAAPFVEEVLALAPNFVFQLNDPSGSASCVDSAGKRVPAPVENSPYGVGSLTFGNSVTSTTAGDAFVGTPGPVATFANNNGGTPYSQLAETIVAIHKTTVTPGPPAVGPWTRLIAIQTSTIPTPNAGMVWSATVPSFLNTPSVACNIAILGGSGQVYLSFTDSNNNSLTAIGSGSICDGNWHLLAISVDPGTGIATGWVDGVSIGTATGIGSGSFVTDVIGCYYEPGHNAFNQGYVGSAACAIELPFAITATQMANLYSSWRTASSGESSGARAQRVLKWIGYAGATAIDSGQTANMGPATDLTGATGLDALNSITLTENGNLFVSNSGVLTFKSRTARYNQTTPTMIFGEGAAWGEWPYEQIVSDFDPTHLFNDIQVTQYSTSQVAVAQDAASQALYSQRILQRTINPASFDEATDAANYLLQQYKSARMRISSITLHPSAVPGLFAALLGLEIGARIRVMRRPPTAPAIQIDCFVESINWDLDPDTGDAFVHLQCSPADLAAYWQLAALHTTLAATASSGASSITINALPDSAVNALASSIPQNQQLTLDPGTSIAETVTIVPPLPATAIGYTTAVLNITPNLINTHSSGAVVCEPLPAGVTNPAVYDLASVLGAMSTTLAASSSSGTNTITVNALADAKYNALGSDLSTGDLLWISPGTPSFEGYNLLTPAQSTAGEDVFGLAAGTAGTALGITAFYGTPTVTASATAWQGANVWQTAVAGGAATGHTPINVLATAVTQNLAYTFSIYVRSATSSANPQVHPYIQFNGGTPTTGSTVTLTGSPTAAWTRLTVTATAPASSTIATVGVVLDAAPSSAWSFQADALQLEQASTASAYNTCPQILSVAAAVPGYSTCVITLAGNLANNHSAGDTVCGPLPPGTTSPTAIAATTRVAY